ncbi:LacI family transcriptional regulator [Aliiruegeria haliotis]|uniref:LacI family transcriptional regulator n=1 Tax=Aliiruegeria haliotis TaxID=1280846 RepID=A0A2T0RLV6_9RHOB|nr:LacI family DNA-binding transcriptional regulator [Aliiruegeria haliotis]PRY22117.1 LacI family transcriptional regulator [Aliiruegeria haliotis]
MKRKPTINDVARVAEVSNMTVSRVVNGRPNVTEDTRRKVLDAMQALGYRPNAVAQSMRSDRTRTIGLLLPDISNATNGSVARVVSDRLREMGYRFLLGSTGFNVEVELDYLKDFQSGVVDGMILFLANDQDPRTRAALSDISVPAVLVDRSPGIAMDRVLSEHTHAMTEAVEHLIAHGHRKIGIIMSPNSMRPGRKRTEAFLETMRRHGLPVDPAHVVDTRQTVEDGYAAAIRMLTGDRPTALIVGANQQVFGAVQAVRELRLRIPDDLSLLGADESQASALIQPPLTMIERDMEAIGEAAISTLLARLETPAAPLQTMTLPSILTCRASCGPPPLTGSVPAGTITKGSPSQ